MDHWRDDWVIVQAVVHDQLGLLIDSPMGKSSG
jgi:hypothetical protein